MYGFGAMYWVFMFSLLATGLLAIIEIIKKKNPQAGEAIEKAASYGGYIGLAAMVTGIISLLQMLRGISYRLQIYPLTTIVLLVAFVSAIVLGLFYSLSLFTSWGILKKEKSDELSAKLAGLKIPFGFAAVGSAVYLLLWGLVRWHF